MNNYKKRKQRYLLALPVIFFCLWLVNIYQWRNNSDLFVIVSIVSFLVAIWFSVPFFMLNKIIDKVNPMDISLCKVVRAKSLAACIVVMCASFICLTLKDVYASFFAVFGTILSFATFSLVERNKLRGIEVLYYHATSLYATEVVKLFVGRLDRYQKTESKSDIYQSNLWGSYNPSNGSPVNTRMQDIHGSVIGAPDSEHSTWDSYNPANGLPMASPGYDMYGNMYGTSDTNSSSTSAFSDSDYNR